MRKRTKLGSLKRICKFPLQYFRVFWYTDRLVEKPSKKSSQSTSKAKEAGPQSSPQQAPPKREKRETPQRSKLVADERRNAVQSPTMASLHLRVQQRDDCQTAHGKI